MRSYEIGVLPTSSCFYFSPTPQTKKTFYYQIGCGHFYCTDDYYIQREAYPPLLLVYVCSGTFCLNLAKESYKANAGEIILLDCDQPHHYFSKNNAEFLYLHFDGPAAHELCRYINKTSGILIDSPNKHLVRQQIESLLEFYETDGNETIFASSARIYSIFSLLDNPNVSPRLQKNDDSIQRAIGYIRANVDKKITLHQLAEISGLSDYYFSHVFKEIIGQSPSEFVINARIDHAKALLINSPLSVNEISKQVGYPNATTLITQFTRRVGRPPAQFRKLRRG